MAMRMVKNPFENSAFSSSLHADFATETFACQKQVFLVIHWQPYRPSITTP
jgi:hypothetical protein